MANNRLYIICKGCRKFMSFAKFYPTDEGSGWYSHMTEEGLNNFFDEHSRCHRMDIYGCFWEMVDEYDNRIKEINMVERKIYFGEELMPKLEKK